MTAYLENFKDTYGRTKTLNHRFHRESRIRYRSGSWDELAADDYDLLKKFIEHHRTYQRPRLVELKDYASGMNHKVSEGDRRRQETDMADARAIHDFGGMVTVFKKGYLTGLPIRVNYSQEGGHDIQERLRWIGKENDFDELNRSLVADMSRMGRAYDIVFRRSDDKTVVRKLNPFETFVIFDQTSSTRSICAVRYFDVSLFDKKKEVVEVYTDQAVYRFEFDGVGLRPLGDAEPHAFGKVPVTEYLNDEDGFGDYETVLNLIDLYDAAQSDTANYMSDLSDAILAIFGNVAYPDGMTQEQQLAHSKAMRKARLMLLRPPLDTDGRDAGQVDAKYLTKSYDATGTEAYKTRIDNDIHKFAYIPNLTDSSFSGTQSGEAMKYKLFGLEQKRIDSTDKFIKSLKRRYELIAAVEGKAGTMGRFDATHLDIVITPNLPKALSDIINNFRALGGIISNETALAITGIVENPQAELAKLDGEIPSLPSGYDEG